MPFGGRPGASQPRSPVRKKTGATRAPGSHQGSISRLRSSPGRRPGATCLDMTRWSGTRTGCDPHRARRPGATPHRTRTHRTGCRCDPHRARRPGATSPSTWGSMSTGVLRSSPGPEARCNPRRRRRRREGAGLRSSPGPEARCNPRPLQVTRCASCGCDPHRARRPDATPTILLDEIDAIWLRSSPGPEARCNSGLVRTGTARHACCDPHRARRPGATRPTSTAKLSWPPLRSSPGPEARCNIADTASVLGPALLRSSPGPEARCNLGGRPRSPRRWTGCDPHRARRPGATGFPAAPRLRLVLVAILTGPGGPVQPAWTCTTRPASSGGCDPHRARRPGAT